MLDIVIVGAGCAGLTQAAFLAHDGHRVLVLERKAGLEVAGGGISIRAGASRVLRAWGCGPALDKVSSAYEQTRWVDAQTDKVLRIFENPSDSEELGLSRPQYQRVLYKEAIKLGVRVQFSRAVDQVVDKEDEKRPYLRMVDGSRIAADLLIVSDGITSRLRPQILADLQMDDPIVVSPSAFYSVVLSGADLRALPHAKTLVEQPDLTVSVADHIYVVSRYVEKYDKWSGLFGVVEHRTGKGLWDERGDIEVPRRHFHNASPALREALDLAKECGRWQLASLKDLPRWTSKAGRVILLGDAAHGMEPNAAQGLSVSIEDAAALAHLLKRMPRSNMSEITALWQRARKPRVENIKTFAAWNTRSYLKPKGLRKGSIMDSSPSRNDDRPDANASYGSLAYQRWLYNFDTVAEVDKLLEEASPRAHL